MSSNVIHKKKTVFVCRSFKRNKNIWFQMARKMCFLGLEFRALRRRFLCRAKRKVFFFAKRAPKYERTELIYQKKAAMVELKCYPGVSASDYSFRPNRRARASEGNTKRFAQANVLSFLCLSSSPSSPARLSVPKKANAQANDIFS